MVESSRSATPDSVGGTPKMSNPVDRTANWTTGTGSPCSLHLYHRRPSKPLGGAANVRIRPRAPPRRGAISRRRGRIEPFSDRWKARVEEKGKPNQRRDQQQQQRELRKGQLKSHSATQDSVGGTPQNVESRRSERELDCWNRLAVLSTFQPLPPSETPWRSRN